MISGLFTSPWPINNLMKNHSICIKNCNNIDQAVITIKPNCLNIKYGPNGLGKSTIAKAILASSKDDGSLESLLPFRDREKPGDNKPEVSGTDNIKNTLIFNDEYTSQFVFQPDEVVKNSFDIFINTDKFKQAIDEIEKLLSDIKEAFKDNQELKDAISDLTELHNACKVTKSDKLSKASEINKALKGGNKIDNIPDKLQPFEKFIKSPQPSTWISWQIKGNDFIHLSDNCPYCSSNLQEGNKKDTARQVSKEYNAKDVQHLSKLQAITEKLGKYFTKDCQEKLNNIIRTTTKLSDEEQNFLATLSKDIETLISKLVGLRSISFFYFRDIEIEKVENEINKLKIDLSLLEKLNSETMQGITGPINEKLNDLTASKIGTLKGEINKNKSQIQKTIKENQKNLNGFLASAGYKYKVEIQSEHDSYKMKLIHQDHTKHLDSASQHLSYGEKNAFALVLFMYQALREKPDLIILDDPVSSFDKTKKFAILNALFIGKENLKELTVLMLTHDIEPIIDTIKILKNIFQGSAPSAYFLSTKSNIISEKEIKSSDIKTFTEICQQTIQSVDDEIIKCIYLRRYFEASNKRELEYHLLSSLLHGKEHPDKNNAKSTMKAPEIEQAKSSVINHIKEFDYSKILNLIKNPHELKERFRKSSVGYDKIQLYRIFSKIHKSDKEDNIMKKFLNESFHIENEYLMQLNPREFDTVPEYIIQKCEELMQHPDQNK
jgi:ABC-type Mn2+/Zn2+ transport system ATPase subunit